MDDFLSRGFAPNSNGQWQSRTIPSIGAFCRATLIASIIIFASGKAACLQPAEGAEELKLEMIELLSKLDSSCRWRTWLRFMR
jgi:hypothetical protein